jgi:hypothetical protein
VTFGAPRDKERVMTAEEKYITFSANYYKNKLNLLLSKIKYDLEQEKHEAQLTIDIQESADYYLERNIFICF